MVVHVTSSSCVADDWMTEQACFVKCVKGDGDVTQQAVEGFNQQVKGILP